MTLDKPLQVLRPAWSRVERLNDYEQTALCQNRLGSKYHITMRYWATGSQLQVKPV
jgi:hypothetical protein